ncbi:hypothetical protein CC2G_014779 [Coprinopsis cinerea AmutBmut pab1-1]|nr:hypothetical protein CC2G_014779 [Coprinopsis cinerea AmutBmut pab1-1]
MSSESAPTQKPTAPSQFILPEHVYFKNPRGRYLKCVPNHLGMGVGLRWDHTKLDESCQFKIMRVPDQPGKFKIIGKPSGNYLQITHCRAPKPRGSSYSASLPDTADGGGKDAGSLQLGQIWQILSTDNADDDSEIYLVSETSHPPASSSRMRSRSRARSSSRRRGSTATASAGTDTPDTGSLFLSNNYNQVHWPGPRYAIGLTTYANDGNKITVERAALKTEICDIVYQTDQKVVGELNPTIAVQKVLENLTGVEASQSVGYKYSKSEEGNWNNKLGFELGQRLTFAVGVPMVGSGEGELTFSEGYEHTWGGSTTESQEVTTSTTVCVPPYTTVELSVLIYKKEITIPFTYTERATLFDGSVVEKKNKEGIYHNVQFIRDHATSSVIGRVGDLEVKLKKAC